MDQQNEDDMISACFWITMLIMLMISLGSIIIYLFCISIIIEFLLDKLEQSSIYNLYMIFGQTQMEILICLRSLFGWTYCNLLIASDYIHYPFVFNSLLLPFLLSIIMMITIIQKNKIMMIAVLPKVMFS